MFAEKTLMGVVIHDEESVLGGFQNFAVTETSDQPKNILAGVRLPWGKVRLNGEGSALPGYFRWHRHQEMFDSLWRSLHCWAVAGTLLNLRCWN